MPKVKVWEKHTDEIAGATLATAVGVFLWWLFSGKAKTCAPGGT